MGDHRSRHRHHRHRHRSHQQTVIGEIATGVGTSLAVALQTAGQVVNHSLRKTDNIVHGVLIGSRPSHGSNSQRNNQQQCPPQQHYPQQPYYPQQQCPPQQHYPQQPYYPQQQYYQQQQSYRQEGPSVTAYQDQGIQNSQSTKLSQGSSNSGSLPVYEPPPAYDDLPSGYREAPPAYTESSSAVDFAVDALTYDCLPPAYVKSPSALAVTSSGPASSPSPAYCDLVPAYAELPQVYFQSNNNGSSLSHGKAVPVYGYPPCYHYKYTDGCGYCLKWKWDS